MLLKVSFKELTILASWSVQKENNSLKVLFICFCLIKSSINTLKCLKK